MRLLSIFVVGLLLLLTGCASLPPPAPVDPQAEPQQKLRAKIDNFVENMTPLAEGAARKLGVEPELVVAHAGLESGWGQRYIRRADGSDSYNLFSLKATASWEGEVTQITTTEFVRGKPKKRVEPFRAYGSFEEAFDDYARLIGSLERYAPAVGRGDDADGFATAIKAGGYATDPAYAEKLAAVARQLLERAGKKEPTLVAGG